MLNVFGLWVIIFLFYFFELLKFCFFLFFFVLSFLREDGGLRRNSRFPDGSFEFLFQSGVDVVPERGVGFELFLGKAFLWFVLFGIGIVV